LLKEAARRKSDTLAEKQAREIEMWNTAKQSNFEPQTIAPLLKSFRPLIRKKANQFAGNVNLPPAAIHAEFQRAAIHAFKRYDPNKGSALNTWLTNNLRKANRWVKKYQNVARIPENRQYGIGLYNTAKANLDASLGREPTTQELAEELGWSQNEVRTLGMELRKDLPTSGFETGYDPTTISPSRDLEKLKLVKYELNPRQRLVYEYTLGDGQPMLKPGEIAKRMGVSPSTISRIRKEIADKLEQY
jgi:DNA-directed RNA polymerase specialized sigma subunit